MNRIGVIAIIIEQSRRSVEKVNHILSEYHEYILARTGIPNKEKDVYVITLVVELGTEELGAITGRLGNLEGVTVKSMLTNKTY